MSAINRQQVCFKYIMFDLMKLIQVLSHYKFHNKHHEHMKYISNIDKPSCSQILNT
jgi:hypothetical protein